MTQAHQKFCRRILRGATAIDAYQHAFPKASASTARVNGPKLLQKPHIQAELTALRAKADAAPGSDFATYAELKKYLTRIIRAVVSELPENSDLWIGRKSAEGSLHLRFPDKLRAIALLLKLLGPEPQAPTRPDQIDAMIMRVRNGTSINQKLKDQQDPNSLLPQPIVRVTVHPPATPSAKPNTEPTAPALQPPLQKAVESSPPQVQKAPEPASAPTPDTAPSTAVPAPSPQDPQEPPYRTIPPGYAGPPPFSDRTDPRVVRPHPSRCVSNNPYYRPGAKAFIRHGKT